MIRLVQSFLRCLVAHSHTLHPCLHRVTPALLATVMMPGAVAAQTEAGTVQVGATVVPDTVEYQSGDLTLVGLLYRPDGFGPHPTVLYLHGSGSNYTRQAAAIGPLYASAGYLTFIPARRGQWLSAGRGEAIVPRMDAYGEEHGAVARMTLMTELLMTEQMDDVRAARHFLGGRADVDEARIAVAGNSFGGILSMFSAAYLDGIQAAVSSAPAALTWSRAPELQVRLREAARATRVPVFLIQAENDADLTPTAELASELAAASKPHQRSVYPAFGTTSADGHSFGYFGGETYGPDVWSFLERAMPGGD